MAEPERLARVQIDARLTAAGWHVCDAGQANIHAAWGVAIREFPLLGVQAQSDKYSKSLPKDLPAFLLWIP